MSTVDCPQCSMSNPDTSKFCGECASPLKAATITCPGCSSDEPRGQKFCGQCATRLTPVIPPAAAPSPQTAQDGPVPNRVKAKAKAKIKMKAKMKAKLKLKAKAKVKGAAQGAKRPAKRVQAAAWRSNPNSPAASPSAPRRVVAKSARGSPQAARKFASPQAARRGPAGKAPTRAPRRMPAGPPKSPRAPGKPPGPPAALPPMPQNLPAPPQVAAPQPAVAGARKPPPTRPPAVLPPMPRNLPGPPPGSAPEAPAVVEGIPEESPRDELDIHKLGGLLSSLKNVFDEVDDEEEEEHYQQEQEQEQEQELQMAGEQMGFVVSNENETTLGQHEQFLVDVSRISITQQTVDYGVEGILNVGSFDGSTAAIKSIASRAQLMEHLDAHRALSFCEHIIRCLGVEVLSSSFNVVVEYMSGGTLRHYMTSGGEFGLGQVEMISTQILRSCCAVNECQMVCRSLSSMSFYVTGSPVSLCKLGVSGLLKRGARSNAQDAEQKMMHSVALIIAEMIGFVITRTHQVETRADRVVGSEWYSQLAEENPARQLLSSCLSEDPNLVPSLRSALQLAGSLRARCEADHLRELGDGGPGRLLATLKEQGSNRRIRVALQEGDRPGAAELFYAMDNCSNTVFAMLLSNRADPSCSVDGQALVFVAIKNDHNSKLAKLLHTGARIEGVYYGERNVLGYIIHVSSSDGIDRSLMLRRLIEYDQISLGAPTMEYNYAAQIEIVKAPMQPLALLKLYLDRMGSPLFNAIIKGHVPLADVLLDYQPVDSRVLLHDGEEWFTPLGVAIFVNNLPMIQLLLDAGADLEQPVANFGSWFGTHLGAYGSYSALSLSAMCALAKAGDTSGSIWDKNASAGDKKSADGSQAASSYDDVVALIKKYETKKTSTRSMKPVGPTSAFMKKNKHKVKVMEEEEPKSPRGSRRSSKPKSPRGSRRSSKSPRGDPRRKVEKEEARKAKGDEKAEAKKKKDEEARRKKEEKEEQARKKREAKEEEARRKKEMKTQKKSEKKGTKNVRGKFVANWDIEKVEDDELAVPEGAIVVRLEGGPDDSYWKVDYNGKKGLVPANFLKPV